MLFLARIYQHGHFMEEIMEVRNSKQIVFRMGFVPTWTLTKLDRLILIAPVVSSNSRVETHKNQNSIYT
jgi:hypothetical protein